MTDRDRMPECRHDSITAYVEEGDGPGRMWACADCMLRFYPACRECVDIGHRNEKHEDPPLDEEVTRSCCAHAIAKKYREAT